MDDIREHQKNKLKNATREIDNRQYSKKLFFHKGKKFVIILALLALVFFSVFGYNIYEKNKVYTEYEVLAISEITQNDDSEYIEFEDRILRYGMDGIVCLEKDNSKVWEISYKMRYPIVALCKDYGAVASQNGKDIYIFNEEGLKGSVKVDYPIISISVAAQGAVAVMMQAEGVNYLDIYEADGEKKIGSRTLLEGNGYPFANVISPDGQKLMVSYLDISEESLESSIVFYNFSEVGQDYIWNMVGVYDDYYDDTMIPYVTFINDTTACAVGDNRITVYGIKEMPEVLCDITLEKELATFFHSDTYLGVVYDNRANGGLYQLEVYDTAGNKVMSDSSYNLNKEYEKIQFVENHILIYDSKSCILLSLDGVERFNYTFDKSFKLLKPLSLTHYVMVANTTMSEIKLK